MKDEKVTFRLSSGRLEQVKDLAEEAGISLSEALRRFVDYGVEAQADTLEREGEIRGEIDEIVNDNQTARMVLPSKWRSHVRGLFADDLADDVSPQDLRVIAGRYRLQAEKMEELAETIPDVPRGDLVGIVDEELAHALEAADLSTWYEGVDNPHERHFSGVSDGMEGRRDVIQIVATVVDAHQHQVASFQDPDNAVAVDVSDLPTMAGSLLPDGVTREDVADLATELVRQGIGPDEVGEYLARDGDEIRVASTTGEPDPPALDDEPTDDEPDTLTRPASETTQEELQQALAAADGGRDPRAVAPERDSVEAMNQNDTADDSSTDTDTNATMEQLVDAGQRAAEAQGGDGDE